jgi:hypothetical protein
MGVGWQLISCDKEVCMSRPGRRVACTYLMCQVLTHITALHCRMPQLMQLIL